jgi:ABC-2 type transport system ATP-binding protein
LSILTFNQVVKRFGAVTAVDDLSFSAPEGRIFGFLGRNGAGKTTSLRMVLDILRPTSGSISVLGSPPGREVLSQIGFLPEERGLYRRMTAIDTIVYFARLKGMRAVDARAAAVRLLAQFDLSASGGKAVDGLSKGMAQKLQLACAIVTNPRLVILDEPFSGLDPISQGALEATIQALAKQGSTVVFSTHVMQHAERLCDRLLLLSRGRKVFEGSQEQARGLLPARISLIAKSDPSSLAMVAEAVAGETDDGWTRWTVSLRQGANGADLLEACFDQGLTLRGFDEHRPSLHDVFLHVAGDEPASGGLTQGEAA